MGKKKWCFGREDVVCLTKDCPYMSECIQVVWQNKMTRLIARGSAPGGGTVPALKSRLKAEANARKKLLRKTTASAPSTPSA